MLLFLFAFVLLLFVLALPRQQPNKDEKESNCTCVDVCVRLYVLQISFCAVVRLLAQIIIILIRHSVVQNKHWQWVSSKRHPQRLWMRQLRRVWLTIGIVVLVLTVNWCVVTHKHTYMHTHMYIRMYSFIGPQRHNRFTRWKKRAELNISVLRCWFWK